MYNRVDTQLREQVKLIKDVYNKLIETTNGEIGYELYKKEVETFENNSSSNDIDAFSELRDVANDTTNFLAYIDTYYKEQSFVNKNQNTNQNTNTNSYQKSYNNGHPLLSDNTNNIVS